MKIWTLYCHTHTDSGRRYIGLTFQTMERRWKKHVYAAFRFSNDGRWHFPNAIRKYGSHAFSHEVLAQSRTLEDANYTEEVLIFQYDTRNPAKGFNIAKGGKHTPHSIRKNPWNDPKYRALRITQIKIEANSPAGKRVRSINGSKSCGRVHGLDTKAKISVASKGSVRTLEQRTKLSRFNTGKTVSSQTRKKLSILGKNRTIGAKTRVRISNSLKNKDKKPYCKNGHSMDDAYQTRRGRLCRTCTHERIARYRSKQRKSRACTVSIDRD